MRVQEKASASCAKMTEEKSMNGGPDGPSESKRGFGLSNADGAQSPNLSLTSDSDKSCSAGGGRLKFFKDGKFILELSHRKEGDRMSWVPVPVKTCWQSPIVAGTQRQESSASLSVSDDNSSVQSSPWQRDHCWKQSTPRRGIGKEMAFFMQPLRSVLQIRNLHVYAHVLRRKRRCPLDSIEIAEKLDLCTDFIQNYPHSNKKLASVKKIGPDPAKLTVIVQTLRDRLDRVRPSVNSSNESVVAACGSSGGMGSASNHSRTVGRMDPSIISPRKRILREMERVSLEDLANNSKRQRPRSTAASQHQPASNNNNVGAMVTCQTLQPGGVLPSSPQAIKGSSYSITSLLAPEEPTVDGGEPSFLRTLLKSPSSPSESSSKPPSRGSSGKCSGRKASPQLCSPTLSPSPDSLRSGLRTPVIPSSHPPTPLPPFLAPPLLYPHYLPHHPATPINPHHLYYSNLPPVPPSYRGSPPINSLWVHYPLSSLPRGALYPGLVPPCHAPPLSPWSPVSPQPLDEFKKDDSPSDVPLNLSKHAG